MESFLDRVQTVLIEQRIEKEVELERRGLNEIWSRVLRLNTLLEENIKRSQQLLDMEPSLDTHTRDMIKKSIVVFTEALNHYRKQISETAV